MATTWRGLTLMAVVLVLVASGCGSDDDGVDGGGSGNADAADTTQSDSSGGSPMEQTLAYADSGAQPGKSYRIAYLTECVNNPYCEKRLAGVRDAAEKHGAEVKVFDANFNPATQLKQVQDAIQQGFDGYVFMPVADGPGCSAFKLLQNSGKPVANGNSPMCGNADYTDGTVGFVAMQTESYFYEHVKNAFESCKSKCEAMAVGGFVGSDLFTRWENAIDRAAKENPNVDVVVDQAGNFDPRVALAKTQDALRANPGIDLVISSWDDMTRGVEQAIERAGKTAGKDIRIYSVGGTKDGVQSVVNGKWNESTVLLPYEESYYPVVQLIRKLEDDNDTPGFTNLAEAPAVVDGPGTIFITADNAAKFEPQY